MKWLDGSEINIKEYTNESLCEKLVIEMWHYEIEQWLNCDEVLQVPLFLIAFDTELTMEGIFTFLENSIGHYAPNIIRSFRAIGDNHDADILEKICQYAPPDIMRGEFLMGNHQEYELTSFNADHELKEEVIEAIEELNQKLYLQTDFDIWKLLYKFLDEQVNA